MGQLEDPHFSIQSSAAILGFISRSGEMANIHHQLSDLGGTEVTYIDSLGRICGRHFGELGVARKRE